MFLVLADTVLIRKPGTIRYELIPLWSWGVKSLRPQIYANILMFVPIGLLLSDKGWKGLLLAIGFSLLIELIQLGTHRGLFEFDDVIHNGVGAGIGIGLMALSRRIKKDVV